MVDCYVVAMVDLQCGPWWRQASEGRPIDLQLKALSKRCRFPPILLSLLLANLLNSVIVGRRGRGLVPL